jgi:hypothetical protein
LNEPCCDPPLTCAPSLSCHDGLTCIPCGGPGQPCCLGGTCRSGSCDLFGSCP